LLLSLPFSLIPRPPSSTLFPYTTLFRSLQVRSLYLTLKTTPFRLFLQSLLTERADFSGRALILVVPKRFLQRISILSVYTAQNRSEEHTSELQSRENLVCRLLLEKKNIN